MVAHGLSGVVADLPPNQDRCAAALPVHGKPGTYSFELPWRTARTDLYLGDPAGGGRARTFAFSSLQAVNVEIAPRVIDDGTAMLAGSCDGAMTVVSRGMKTTYPAGARFAVTRSPAKPRDCCPAAG